MEETIEPTLAELVIINYEGDINDDNGQYHGQGCATFDNSSSYEGSIFFFCYSNVHFEMGITNFLFF